MSAPETSLRALLIGGTGFIGLNVALALRAAGHHPVIARRRASNTLPARSLGLALALVASDDADAMTTTFRDYDVVFMLAGHYPRVSLAPEAEVARGVAALAPVLTAARQAGVRLVFTSSIATELAGDSAYQSVKRALEREVLAAVEHDLDAVIVRPGGCLGPWDWKPGLGFVIVGALADRLPPWCEGPVHLVHVSDVATVHVDAAIRGVAGRTYPALDSAGPASYGALMSTLAELTGAHVPAPSSLDTLRALADAEERQWLATRRGRPSVSRELVDIVAAGQASLDPAYMLTPGAPLSPRCRTALIDAIAWYRTHGFAPANASVQPTSSLLPGAGT